MSDFNTDQQYPPISSLSKRQRRVLGTLIEKALTVPDSYPLTVNSLISGCNQKSNRSPLTSFDETDIEDTINELQDLGLVAAVHTDGARTEKYRHYVRRRFTLTEPQIGILAELLLRGRQAVGELRTRASRMTPKGTLDTQEQLRVELQGLLNQKLIQADGPLDRRGVEVDHNLYQPQEGQGLAYRETVDEPADGNFATRGSVRPEITGGTPANGNSSASGMSQNRSVDANRQAELESQIVRMGREIQELKGICDDLRRELTDVSETLDRLQRDLGV